MSKKSPDHLKHNPIGEVFEYIALGSVLLQARRAMAGLPIFQDLNRALQDVSMAMFISIDKVRDNPALTDEEIQWIETFREDVMRAAITMAPPKAGPIPQSLVKKIEEFVSKYTPLFQEYIKNIHMQINNEIQSMMQQQAAQQAAETNEEQKPEETKDEKAE